MTCFEWVCTWSVCVAGAGLTVAVAAGVEWLKERYL
jgi:hypothetical protein